MSGVLAVAAMWLAFAGTHIGLAAAPIRTRMVARLGAGGFVIAYTVIASVLFAALVATYAEVAARGPAGPDLASTWARTPLIVLIVIGFALAVAAFAPAGYWASPAVSSARACARPSASSGSPAIRSSPGSR